MATEICTSEWDLPLRKLFGLSGRRRRRRLRSDANLMMNISNKLGADLLVEILIRLPNPRSAGRCKLVCKLWSSVISDPSFSRRYVSHHQTMNPHDLKSIVLSFLPPMPHGVQQALKVLDCNRDLVLCGFWDLNLDNGERSRSYLVCNLFTKQWSALPLAPEKSVRYASPLARLVCEPLQPSSGYRFRVACIYHQSDVEVLSLSTRLDVFCSESGEWTKDAVVGDGHIRCGGLVSCNGELVWVYSKDVPPYDIYFVAVFNPFRLDVPPTFVDVSVFLAKPLWFITVCQDALHVIVQEDEGLRPLRSSVWRLEEDRKSWRKQCEGLVNKTPKCCNDEADQGFFLPFLHSQRPEIVFFHRVRIREDNNAILCCDLRSGEVEFFAKLEGFHDARTFFVFQPRVSSRRFTPIPKFGNMDNESFSFLFKSSNNEMRDSNSKLPRVTRSGLRKQQVLGSKQQ